MKMTSESYFLHLSWWWGSVFKEGGVNFLVRKSQFHGGRQVPEGRKG